jgi:alkylhydroperoxidase family enzyme
MAWIRTVDPGDAGGELLDVLREITGQPRPQRLANVYASTTLRPRTLLAMARLNDAVNFQNHDSGLTRLQREMIAAVVSATNRCRY